MISLFLLILLYSHYCQPQNIFIPKIAENYECDPKCWFNETEVNSTTIGHWPVNCSSVCSWIGFSSQADVPIFELQAYFKNLKVLKGGIEMFKSEYVSTSFFANLEELHCEVLGTYFAFNTGLKELSFPNLKSIDCPFYAYNNTILNAVSFCDKFEDTVEMFVYDNFKNCRGCVVSGKIDYSNVRNYENCSALVGPTDITDTYIQLGNDLSPLSSVVNINGSVKVYYSDLLDLSFFKSLKFIKSNHYYVNDMELQRNYNMTRFNIPSLKSLNVTDGFFTLSIEKVHPDFCLTTEEMDMFMRSEVRFNQLEAIYCLNETRDSDCEFENMESLGDHCVGVIGKVLISTGDEPHVGKLKTVKTIYGRLTIQDTNLTNLDFLRALEYISLLNDTTTGFQVMGNKQLQNVDMPSLKRVHSKSKYQISFYDNGEELLNSTACLQLMKRLVITNVVFDGQECEAIDRSNEPLDDFSSRHGILEAVFLMIVIITFSIVF